MAVFVMIAGTESSLLVIYEGVVFLFVFFNNKQYFKYASSLSSELSHGYVTLSPVLSLNLSK